MDNTPHSKDAEEALLGSVLINPEAFFEVNGTIQASDFFILRNQYVWEAMETLQARGDVIDYIPVLEELKAKERLDLIGGGAYVMKLTLDLATATNAQTYGHIVKRASIRRRVLDCAGEITAVALNEELDIYEVEAAARSIIEKPFNGATLRKSRDMAEITNAAEQWIFQDDKEGIRFYISDIDKILGDLIGGDYLVISARTGVGKSRFMFQAAMRNARRGKRVLILTTEMSEEEVVWVLVEMLSETGIQVRDIRNKAIKKNEKQVAEFLELTVLIAGLPMTIERVDGFTVEQVAALVLRHPPDTFDLIIMDYSQRLKPSPGYDRKRSDEEIGNRAFTLRNLAQRVNTVILDAAQFNRDSAGKNQGTEHVRGSDQIAHEAVFLLGIERDDEPANGKTTEAIIRFKKGRFIPGGLSVTTFFHPTKGTYDNAVTTTVELNPRTGGDK